MGRIGQERSVAALAALLVALSATGAGAMRHGPRVHHGHPINAWGGSHHLKLR